MIVVCSDIEALFLRMCCLDSVSLDGGIFQKYPHILMEGPNSTSNIFQCSHGEDLPRVSS